MVLVDSSAWIEAIRRKGLLEVKVAVEALLEAYEATLCPPVQLEVLGGARQQERRHLQAYFQILPCAPLPETIWQKSIKFSWRLRDEGMTVPWNDLLIATIAIETNCRLYAIDKHFEAMAEKIPLRLYHPGYGGSFSQDESASR